MGVVGLHEYLVQHDLIHADEPISALHGCRISIDGYHWLRNTLYIISRAHHSPFPYTALGGHEFALRSAVMSQAAYLATENIEAIFVFSGLRILSEDDPIEEQLHMTTSTSTSRSNFSKKDQQNVQSAVDRRLERRQDAWKAYERGDKVTAEKLWSSGGHISAATVEYFIALLEECGQQCFRAPYSSWAQMAWLDHQGYTHAAWVGREGGGAEMFLYKTDKHLLSLDLARGTFDWVDRESVLTCSGLSESQWVDACILTGGIEGLSVCPAITSNQRHYFSAVVEAVAKFGSAENILAACKEPLDTYKRNYGRVRAAADNHFVLRSGCNIVPLFECSTSSSTNGDSVKPPEESFFPPLSQVVSLWLAVGLVSPSLANACMSGTLRDPAPVCGGDTLEFRRFRIAVQPLRARAIALTSKATKLSRASVVHAASWFDPYNPTHLHYKEESPIQWASPATTPDGTNSLVAAFTASASPSSPATIDNNISSSGALVTTVCLRLLQERHFRGPDSSANSNMVMGKAVRAVPAVLESSESLESVCIALELARWGFLNGERYLPVVSKKKAQPMSEYDDRLINLVSRVASLSPLSLRAPWSAGASLDLLRFHSMASAVWTALGDLARALLLSLVAERASNGDVSIEVLQHARRALPFGVEGVPSTCAGLVVRKMLTTLPADGSIGGCDELEQHFPAAANVVADVVEALNLWDRVASVMTMLSNEGLIEVEFVASDIVAAVALVNERRSAWGLPPST